MVMTLTNNEIYNYATSLSEEFGKDNISLPIKVNFYLQKNIKELIALAQEIEEKRIEIAKKYGEVSEDGNQYQVPEDKIQDASNELEELFGLTQDVNIYKISLDAFGDIELTASQMKALLFMIEDE